MSINTKDFNDAGHLLPKSSIGSSDPKDIYASELRSFFIDLQAMDIESAKNKLKHPIPVEAACK